MALVGGLAIPLHRLLEIGCICFVVPPPESKLRFGTTGITIERFLPADSSRQKKKTSEKRWQVHAVSRAFASPTTSSTGRRPHPDHPAGSRERSGLRSMPARRSTRRGAWSVSFPACPRTEDGRHQTLRPGLMRSSQVVGTDCQDS